ncbi:acyltransferase [Parashewanella spongiae]|uniref:acyltransferase n=1 Tax=Parashewanella spongiae TaxID=342950 RepID=UPI0026B41823
MALLRGLLAFTCYVINTLFWMLPILCVSALKLLPLNSITNGCSYLLDHCASNWISVNALIERVFHPVTVNVSGAQHFSTKEWYMVTANHQSWVDILILQSIFNRKIPFLKFFLKKELLYVPVLGLAWWALDFPFMHRYSTSQLRKNPKLKGKDIEVTRAACAKFKNKPVSVMNFVEGTRFSPQKHQKQNSPFKHLLRPKAGGMAFTLSAMNDCINKLIDVTIHYPETTPSFWQYISGQVNQVYVHISVNDIDENMKGDYANDRKFKQGFQQSLTERWNSKDLIFEQLIEKSKEGRK